jgi:uncharacterized protein (TIGR02271 family)
MTDITYETGNTLSAFFDTRSEAERAADSLRAAGISDASIRIEGRDFDTGERTHEEEHSDRGDGRYAPLSNYYISEEDRYSYSEGIRRGGYVVFVTGATGGHRDRVFDIFETSGAVDFDERERTWRSEGWTGYSGSASENYGSAAASGQASLSDRGDRIGGAESYASGREQSVPGAQEQLRLGKRDTSHGRVRVRSYVREEPVSEEVTLRDEHVEVERRPADRAAGVGEDAFRDRTIEAEERSEEAVVDKQARVVEEVGLRKESNTRRETVSDTVRHTEVDIDRDDDPASRR